MRSAENLSRAIGQVSRGLTGRTGDHLNQGQGGMCICRTPGIGPGIGLGIWPGIWQERFGPRLQHRRQRRLTSPLRLASPARKLPTLSCTLALLPRHRLPVASSLAQPQMDSSR